MYDFVFHTGDYECLQNELCEELIMDNHGDVTLNFLQSTVFSYHTYIR